MKKRIIVYASLLCLMFIIPIIKIYLVINDETVLEASQKGKNLTVDIKLSEPYIYDRNYEPLINQESVYKAVVNPKTVNLDKIYPALADKEDFMNKAKANDIFVCDLNYPNINDINTPVFETKKTFSDDYSACHVLGYLYEGGGCGVMGLYKDYFENHESYACVSYGINALGDVLNGQGCYVNEDDEYKGGVVLSIDKDIQEICENAMRNIEKGALIVMNPKSGDILALVSKPTYNANDIESYLDDENSPFVNRAFSGYSVGSVFKTVIAACALEYGISEDFSAYCSGKIMVGNQRFNCHYWAGHGKLDMRSAIVESCNPYFITLSQNIPNSFLEDFMINAGFSEDIDVDGLICKKGYLPSVKELSVKAEKANLSFGQGKLSSSPLQICRFICAIANNGYMPYPNLIYGTIDSTSERISKGVKTTKIMSESTADKIKSFMYDTLYKEGSAAILTETNGGAKTSTAQTGKYDQNGNEILNCWFAGFFPYENPEYAAVIVADDGVSGNLTCGGVFKEIAENIM